MIDLSKGVAIIPNTKRAVGNYQRGYDVTVSLNRKNKNDTAKSVTAFTFYGDDLKRTFANHWIVPYIVGDKIAFVINDKEGYSVSKQDTKTCWSGRITSNDGMLRLAVKDNLGGYIMEYDRESRVHYINLREKVEDLKA